MEYFYNNFYFLEKYCNEYRYRYKSLYLCVYKNNLLIIEMGLLNKITLILPNKELIINYSCSLQCIQTTIDILIKNND